MATIPDVGVTGAVLTAAEYNKNRTGLTENPAYLATARGDLFRATASGAIERYALGAAGKYLKSDGTDPVWGDGGAWQFVEAFNENSGAAVASVTFTLPSGATAVKLNGSLMTDAASRDIWLRINGLSTSIYTRQDVNGFSTTAGATAASAQAQIALLGGNIMQTGVLEGISFDLSIQKRIAAEAARVTGTVAHRAASSASARALNGTANDTSNALASVTLLLSSTGGFYGQVIVEAYVP